MKQLFLSAMIVWLSLVMVTIPDDSAYAQGFGGSVEEKVNDPLESLNRKIFRVNEVLFDYVLRPTVRGYRKVMPQWGRDRVHHFFNNLTEPVTLANAILQGDVDHSFTTFWRFMINTTWGVGGMFDIAGQEGLKRRSEDFGQTLGHYGVGGGPFLMLPVLGPHTTRAAGGRVVDIFFDPLNYEFVDDEWQMARRVGDSIDSLDQVHDVIVEVERTSFDPYATLRSMYLQNRESNIRNE